MTAKCASHSSRQKLSLFVCLFLTAACGFVGFTFSSSTRRPLASRGSGVGLPTFSDEEVPGRNGTKIILFWTSRAGTRNWFSFPESFVSRSLAAITPCPRQDCVYTSDHSRQERADVLLFFLDVEPNWPPVRYGHQYYAHFIHEAPGRRPTGRTFLDRYDGAINVTINFRRDADLYLPYNVFLPVPDQPHYEPRFGNKTRMAVWPVSHCHTESRREDYVADLARYLTVDVYGRCGDRQCPRSGTHACLEAWQETYKFYLSFENNICDDYITEKAFLPLQYEIIPIVLGGANYTRDTPPHSVINARDFDSPKHLARFLIRLAADETRYRSYFAWKTHYKMVGGMPRFLCRLCEDLHENNFPRRPAKANYADYWYGVHGERCDNDLVSRLLKKTER